MDRSKWGVHEAHCCPKHGCKYGDPDCPVVLRETHKYNMHCEMCEIDYNDPDPVKLLIAWINSRSELIHKDKKSIVELGIKEGWWRKGP